MAGPIPAGAQALGITTQLFSVNPTLADVGFNGHTNDATHKLYSGTWSQANPPPDTSHFVAGTGPLTLIQNGTDGQTFTNVCTQQMNQTAGLLPYIDASRPFYAQATIQQPSFVMDNWPSVYMFPQQHNNTQDDFLPSPPFPATVPANKYEAFGELDIAEGGFGSYSQALNTFINWQGQFSALPTIASASQSGTVFTTASQAYTANAQLFIQGTAPAGFANSTPYYVLATGLTSTTLSLAATPGGAAITAGSSSACTLNPGYLNQTTNNANSGPVVDFTLPHRFGMSYSPQKRQVTYYTDDVQTAQYSTSVGGPGLMTGFDTYSVQAWKYYLIVAVHSHGTNQQFQMTVFNMQAWQ